MSAGKKSSHTENGKDEVLPSSCDIINF